MGHNVIRISYARAAFAAQLLVGCRSALMQVIDRLRRDQAQHTTRQTLRWNTPAEALHEIFCNPFKPTAVA